jgi:hypothetical protein
LSRTVRLGDEVDQTLFPQLGRAHPDHRAEGLVGLLEAAFHIHQRDADGSLLEEALEAALEHLELGLASTGRAQVMNHRAGDRAAARAGRQHLLAQMHRDRFARPIAEQRVALAGDRTAEWACRRRTGRNFRQKIVQPHLARVLAQPEPVAHGAVHISDAARRIDRVPTQGRAIEQRHELTLADGAAAQGAPAQPIADENEREERHQHDQHGDQADRHLGRHLRHRRRADAEQRRRGHRRAAPPPAQPACPLARHPLPRHLASLP